MIHEITPHDFNNTYLNRKPDSESIAVIVKGDTMLICEENESFYFPSFSHITLIDADTYFLFAIDDVDYYWLDGSYISDMENSRYLPVSSFRARSPKHLSFAGVTAMHLIHWYQINRFCGQCGSTLKRDAKERRLCCDSCGNMVYPRIAPAVIAGVINGDKLLLIKYAGRAYANYALVAGFTEIGESAEETVRREVLEETGISVKNITYFKSQPWALTNTLLMGFFCELDGDDTIQVNEQELSEAIWVSREDIAAKYEDYSLTNEMICHFKELPIHKPIYHQLPELR